MEEDCVSPFGFGEAKGDRVEEGGGYFQLRGKAGVEKDAILMWVFLFPLSGGCFFLAATVFSSFACSRGRWWTD